MTFELMDENLHLIPMLYNYVRACCLVIASTIPDYNRHDFINYYVYWMHQIHFLAPVQLLFAQQRAATQRSIRHTPNNQQLIGKNFQSENKLCMLYMSSTHVLTFVRLYIWMLYVAHICFPSIQMRVILNALRDYHRWREKYTYNCKRKRKKNHIIL